MDGSFPEHPYAAHQTISVRNKTKTLLVFLSLLGSLQLNINKCSKLFECSNVIEHVWTFWMFGNHYQYFIILILQRFIYKFKIIFCTNYVSTWTNWQMQLKYRSRCAPLIAFLSFTGGCKNSWTSGKNWVCEQKKVVNVYWDSNLHPTPHRRHTVQRLYHPSPSHPTFFAPSIQRVWITYTPKFIGSKTRVLSNFTVTITRIGTSYLYFTNFYTTQESWLNINMKTSCSRLPAKKINEKFFYLLKTFQRSKESNLELR